MIDRLSVRERPPVTQRYDIHKYDAVTKKTVMNTKIMIRNSRIDQFGRSNISIISNNRIKSLLSLLVIFKIQREEFTN